MEVLKAKTVSIRILKYQSEIKEDGEMEINSSLADFLQNRLICIWMANGDRVCGVFENLSYDNIILQKPCEDSDKSFDRVRYLCDDIEKIIMPNDMTTARVLNIGIKASKKVRKAVDKWRK